MLAFILAGIALPIVIGGGGRKVVLESAGLQASSRDTFHITTPIALPAAPHVRIERGTLTLAANQPGRTSPGEDTAQLLASGAARLLLRDAVVTIEPEATAAAAGGHAEGSAEDAPLPAALLRLGFEAITVRDSELRFRRPDGSSMTLGDVSAEVVHKRKTALTARGTFGALGQKLGFEATVGLVASGKSPARYPLKASIKGALIEGQLDGRLGIAEAFSVQGQASLAISSIRSAARWLGHAWSQGPGLEEFRARGQLEWTGRALAFQRATLQMDGNEATGTLSINMAASRPSVEGTLALNTLDLSRYLKGDTAARSAADILQRAAGHDGTDLSLPLVRQLDSDIRISANKVKLGGIELGRSAITLALKSGRLIADIAEFEHDGGRGSGQVTVDMNMDLPRYTVRGRLSDFDLGRLVSAGIGQQVLSGRGDMSIDIGANGETITQLVRTLEGKASIEVNEGARLGIDLNTLLVAPQRRTLDGWSFLTRGQTPVEQLKGRFVLSQGVVATELLEATMADTIVSLSGQANLSQRTIDASVRGARKLAAGASPGEPVSVKGPWANPQFRSAEAQRKAADGSSAPDGR